MRLPTLAILLILGASSRAEGPSPARDVTKPPSYDSFVVVPLRVHLLESDDLPEVHCRLSDDDVRRIIAKVNAVWSLAGVHFGLESIVREPAARERRFQIARDLNGGKIPLGLYRLLVPDGPSRGFEGLHVYYIHDFSVNGVYMGEDFAIVRDSASLREVEGGIDEPIPRVTAHELGHALGLAHRQDRTNLLASGTTGTILNTTEVETAWSRARETEGARTVERLRDQARRAEEEGRLDEARQVWQWLSQIPGAEADEARQRLRALESTTPDIDSDPGERGV